MKLKISMAGAALISSSQALAFGDFLGNVLQGAAQQAVSGAIQQQAQPAQPVNAQGVAPNQAYGTGGCVQNVPAGPPGSFADVNRDGCVTHLEYSNWVTYLANNAPQYLGAGQAAAPAQAFGANPYPAQAGNSAANAAAATAAAAALNNQQGTAGDAQAVGNAVQGLMGLIGR